MGEGREGTSMLNFTHSSISDWKNCNSNTNVPQTEQKFDKVNTEKMNLLPSLSRALCGTVIHANPTTFVVASDLTTKPETSRLLITCAHRACTLHSSDITKTVIFVNTLVEHRSLFKLSSGRGCVFELLGY